MTDTRHDGRAPEDLREVRITRNWLDHAEGSVLVLSVGVALALAVGAILAMFRFKAGMLPVLGVCSVLGAAYVMII